MLVLAFLIGAVSGLRSLTAPAAVALAAHLLWLDLHGTPVAFMGSTAALIAFALLAAGELVADQLPSTPNRTSPAPLSARIALGALSGACMTASAARSIALGALLGAAGGIAGAFAGYKARTRLVRALKVPDSVIAVVEDAVAIGAGLFIVSR